MTTFFEMGGYAAFVWPAYAVSIVGLAAMVITTLRAYARAKAKLSAVPQR
jgi:heme exporter protein D